MGVAAVVIAGSCRSRACETDGAPPVPESLSPAFGSPPHPDEPCRSSQSGAQALHHLIAGHCRYGSGIKFGFTPVGLAGPGLLDFTVFVQADDQALQQARPFARSELQDFGFEGLNCSGHGSSLPGMHYVKAKLATE